MPVLITAITAYADSVGRPSALQRDADSEACGDASDGPSSSNNEVFSFVPTTCAVLTALSLCQVSLMVCVSVCVGMEALRGSVCLRLSLHQFLYQVFHGQFDRMCPFVTYIHLFANVCDAILRVVSTAAMSFSHVGN